MKTSTILTTTSLVTLLSSFALVACGGAEVEPAAQTQTAGVAQAAPDGSTREAMRPDGREQHGPGGHHFHGPPSPEKMLERFDANKDGKLQASELPERMQERIAEIDTSGDGVVTKDELDAAFAARRAAFIEKAKQRFDAADLNHDGALEQSELGEKWAKLSVADANSDQKLTPDELRSAFEAGKLKPMPGERGHFRHGDKPAPAAAPAAPAAPAQ